MYRYVCSPRKRKSGGWGGKFRGVSLDIKLGVILGYSDSSDRAGEKGSAGCRLLAIWESSPSAPLLRIVEVEVVGPRQDPAVSTRAVFNAAYLVIGE